jgi:acyl-CoA synthetase (AMP-forming)/AMP-acid ligase II
VSDDRILEWRDELALPQGEIGEIAVRGPLVSRGYFDNPEADLLSKIPDRDGFWHRMGDLGWVDRKGRIWFCGRKSHRVITARGTLYTIPCESIFNTHPLVRRSALVGLGPRRQQVPVVCIELRASTPPADRKALTAELLALAGAHEITRGIRIVLFHPGFPVDIRHNAKIFREQLAAWASGKVKAETLRRCRQADLDDAERAPA